MKKLILIPLIFLLSFSGFAQFKFTHIPQDGIRYGYVEALPVDYVEGEKLPIIIAMGGVGEGGSGTVSALNKMYSTGVMMLVKNNILKFPERCIVLAPQSSGGWMNSKVPVPAAGIYNFMEYVKKNYPNDGRRILTGLSAGGANTWAYIEFYPGYITAAIPCAYYGHEKPEGIAQLVKTPIWAFCASGDFASYNNGLIYKAVKAKGGEIFFTQTPGGHTGWNEFYKRQEVWKWAFSKGKIIVDPAPEPEPEPEPEVNPQLVTLNEVLKLNETIRAYTLKQDSLIISLKQ